MRQEVWLSSAGTLAVLLSQKAASAAVPAALVSSTAKAATGALAATSGVSTSAGAKTAALVKAAVKSFYLGKAAVAATAGGVTLAAVLAVAPSQKAGSGSRQQRL